MRDAFVRYQEQYWRNFTPSVRGLARRLWDAGFSPIAFDDDDDEEDDELDEPSVFLACSPENLIAEAHRLHELLRSWHIPAYEVACSRNDGATCGLEAVYDPIERDACLILWGIDDKMLGPDLGKNRAAGRSPANTRSGGAGIAR